MPATRVVSSTTTLTRRTIARCASAARFPAGFGQIVLAEVVNGLRRECPAPRTLNSTDGELLLTLRRENDLTIVHEPSFRSNIQVRQAPPTVPSVKSVGLLAVWNLVRFDDVVTY